MEAIHSSGTFVILFHQGKGPDHYDLILEGIHLCPTFRFEEITLNKGVRIKDHQKKYLNFEGQISPEKGHITVQDKGKFTYANQEIQLIGKLKIYSFSIDTEDIFINL